MKATVILASLLALSCCSPHAIQPGGYVRQSIPGVTPPVAGSASLVRSAAGEVDRNAAVVDARAGVISRETRSLREALSSATTEADRMRKLASATREEMNELWLRLTDITRRSALLEDEAAAAVKQLDEQRELRRLATVQIIALEIAARNKDAEARDLRVQYLDEQAKSEAAHNLAGSNATAAATARTVADNLRGQRKVWIGFTIAASLVAAALAFLTYGLPLIRRSVIGL
jgi:hypothetical protein